MDRSIYGHLRETLVACKGIQDSLGFWIPRHAFRIPGTELQSSFSEILELYSGFQIPRFQIPQAKFPGFRNLVSLTGENPFFLTPRQTPCFYILASGSSSYGHLFRFPRVPAYDSICCGSISYLIQILFSFVSNSLSHITIPKNTENKI